MHHRRKAAIVVGALLLGTAAAAQAPANDTGGVATQTQERLARGQDDETIWNVLGLLGLLGLIGFKRPSDNDGYTNDPI